MIDSAAAHLSKSHDALRAGTLLVDGDEAEAAINRAYYAIFHAAAAALVQAGEDVKTHKGAQNRFWTRFVETGRFPRPLASCLSYGRSGLGQIMTPLPASTRRRLRISWKMRGAS